MRKLINDIIQYSDAPEELKSPDLSDIYLGNSFTITLDQIRRIDCIGIGYTDATTITVNGQDVTYIENGLYLVNEIISDTLIISHNGTFIGRLAAGINRFFGCAPSREPGLYTTNAPRKTLSGQVVPGAGGYSGREISLDYRYKIDRDIYQDFQDAYSSQVSRGFPFFLYFDKETHRMPYERLYADTDNNLLFQSSVNFFKYSRRFKYMEAF